MEVVAQIIMDTRQAKGEIDNKSFNLSVVIEIQSSVNFCQSPVILYSISSQFLVNWE